MFQVRIPTICIWQVLLMQTQLQTLPLFLPLVKKTHFAEQLLPKYQKN